MDTTHYRYPGPQPFTTEQADIFFGRQAEIVALQQLLDLEQMVLLFSKSGMGKSSLINAGLIPQLENTTSFKIRFGAYAQSSEVPSPLESTKGKFGRQSLLLERIRPEEDDSLWLAIKQWQLSQENRKTLLLVFDQFEELFTFPKEQIESFALGLSEVFFSTIPTRYRERLELLLGEDRNILSSETLTRLHEPIRIKALFAIRSDRMSQLNQIKSFLPEIFEHSLELNALSWEQAEDAILSPAFRKGAYGTPVFDFEDEAVDRILDFLSQNNTTRIESFQLQILCESIEKNIVLRKSNRLVKSSDIKNLEVILENYYLDKIQEIKNPEDQLSARRFLEEGLIFEEEERRLSLYEGQVMKSYGVTPELLQQLLNTHLIRSESSIRGGFAYELSHDTLVAPVLKAKAERRTVERERQLAREREAQEQVLQRERKRRRRATLLAIVGFLLAITSFVATFFAVQQASRAREARIEAEAQRERADNARLEADTKREEAELALKNFNVVQFNALEERVEVILIANFCPNELLSEIRSIAARYPEEQDFQQRLRSLEERVDKAGVCRH